MGPLNPESIACRERLPIATGGPFMRCVALSCFFLVVSSVAAAATAGKANTLRGGALPLVFEENRGQVDGSVRYLCRRGNHDLFLTDAGATLLLNDRASVSFAVQGGVMAPEIRGENRLPGHSNYLRGNDPAAWQVGVPHFGRVRYRQIMEGVDLVFHGRGGQLEYDFELAPGRDPADLEVVFQGGGDLQLTAGGELLFETDAGPVRQKAPIAWQVIDGERTPVSVAYDLRGPDRTGFRVGHHDPQHALVIDPVLVYATFYGGGNYDFITGLDVDGAGNVYITGATSSADLPLLSPVQTDQPGEDIFVAGISADGSSLLFSTYLGGLSGSEQGRDLDLDPSGNVCVVGYSSSVDFPVTGGAVQPATGGILDAVAMKLSPAGALLYATFLGGSTNDKGMAIACAADGDLIIAGHANSNDFPTTNGAYQETKASASTDAFVARIDPDVNGLPGLQFSTFFGGSGFEDVFDLCLESGGAVWLVGITNSDLDLPITAGAIQGTYGGATDAFVTRLAAGGSAVTWSSYLGGAGRELWHNDAGICTDSAGHVLVVGSTRSGDFPTSAGSYQPQLANGVGGDDGFVVKIDPDAAGGNLVWSTHLGGSNHDRLRGVAVDDQDDVWVCGVSNSQDFPLVDSIKPAAGGPSTTDAVIARLSADGSSLLSSSAFGGVNYEDADEIRFGPGGDLFVGGWSGGDDFPATPGAFRTAGTRTQDAFVARIDPACTSIEKYGTVTVGSGSLQPRFIGYGGCPCIGTAQFRIHADNLVGGAQGMMLIGFNRSALPFRGATLLVELVPPFFLVPLITSGTPGVAGDGAVSLTIGIPNDPNGVGIEVDAQFVVQDPGAALGIATTDGLAFVICDGG